MVHTYFYQLELSVTKIKDAKIFKDCYVKYPFKKIFVYIFIYLFIYGRKFNWVLEIHFHLTAGKTTTLVIKMHIQRALWRWVKIKYLHTHYQNTPDTGKQPFLFELKLFVCLHKEIKLM